MKIIDKYIIKELIIPFSSGVLAFSTILLGSTVLFKLINDTVKYGIPINDMLILILLKLPQIIAISIPMSTLFASLSAFGRLGNDLEILAFRANGISIFRLLLPVIFAGIFISFINIWFSEIIVPSSATVARNLYLTYKEKDSPKIQNNINLTEYKNNLPYRIINIREKQGLQLKNITIAEYEKGNLSRLINSKSGEWKNEGAWHFYDGIMHSFQQNNKKRVTVIEFEKEFINIDLKPIDLTNRKKNIEEMTRKELTEKINFEKRMGNDPTKLIMDLHTKTAIAFSSLIYCILGASMGLKPHRSSSSMNIGVSLIIIFGYIILMAIGTGLGLAKIMPPIIAAWIPNISIGIISILIVKKLATA